MEEINDDKVTKDEDKNDAHVGEQNEPKGKIAKSKCEPGNKNISICSNDVKSSKQTQLEEKTTNGNTYPEESSKSFKGASDNKNSSEVIDVEISRGKDEKCADNKKLSTGDFRKPHQNCASTVRQIICAGFN